MSISYPKFLDTQLPQPQSLQGPRVLDVFAGCGGLSLGFEAAGFQVTGYEMNSDACATYRANLRGDCHCGKLTTTSIFPAADIVIGGPPCQPFSVIGHQEGREDRRNGLEVFIHTVQQVQPKLWMFENVKGLLGKSSDYLQDVLKRLEALGYQLEQPHVFNAKYYGVPQSRERVVVVGHRMDKFEWPAPFKEEYTVREAIRWTASRSLQTSRFVTSAMDSYIAKYEKASCCRTPRDLSMDRPARTLTCRNLGGATGDMIRLKLPDGRRRLLTVKEAARLQSFPSWFRFIGTHTSQMNQVGNAVPPMLALMLAKAVKKALRTTPKLAHEQTVRV